VGLVEPVPGAAVDEHVHGRRATAGGEDVEAVAGVGAVGEIEPAVERGARLGAGDRVPRQPVGALLDLLTVVVLGVEGVLVVVAIDALRHLAATMPKAPGACQRSRLRAPTAMLGRGAGIRSASDPCYDDANVASLHSGIAAGAGCRHLLGHAGVGAPCARGRGRAAGGCAVDDGLVSRTDAAGSPMACAARRGGGADHLVAPPAPRARAGGRPDPGTVRVR